MQPKQEIGTETKEKTNLEVVVGVFANHEDVSRVAASLRSPDLKIQRVSRRDPLAPNSMPEIVYEEVDEVGSENVMQGAMIGGAIGVGSGLLLMGVPGLNVAAPLAGMIAGAWIGAVAGVDETVRGIELPTADDYQKMLANGKSFLVIAGDESTRAEYAAKMIKLGAEEVHQHPPVMQAVRSSSS